MIVECEQCGKKFDKVTPRHKFCSGKCKQIAWAVRESKKEVL